MLHLAGTTQASENQKKKGGKEADSACRRVCLGIAALTHFFEVFAIVETMELPATRECNGHEIVLKED